MKNTPRNWILYVAPLAIILALSAIEPILGLAVVVGWAAAKMGIEWQQAHGDD